MNTLSLSKYASPSHTDMGIYRIWGLVSEGKMKTLKQYSRLISHFRCWICNHWVRHSREDEMKKF